MKVSRIETQGSVGFGRNGITVMLVVEEGADIQEAPQPIALSPDVKETLVRFLGGTP